MNKNILSPFEQWTRTQLARDPRLVARLCNWYGWLATLPRPTRRWLKRKMVVTFAAAALLLALCATPIAHASSMTVTAPGLGYADDGKCSLVEAIYNSNTDSQRYTSVGECPAGSGADTIALPASADFDYLTNFGGESALPAINSTIIVNGNGSTIRRDAGASNEFGIVAMYYADLTLNDTTISGGFFLGDEGGGIYDLSGTLTLNDSTVSGNKAGNGGGIYLSSNNYGSYVTQLNNSVVSGNIAYNVGGGIESTPSSSIVINNSTISDNHAVYAGGGIITSSTSQIANSTISGNTSYYGGGIVNIMYDGGTLTIARSTLSGNKAYTTNPTPVNAPAGGGILNITGTIDIEQSMIDSNQAQYYGGGIFNALIFGCRQDVANQPQTAACDAPVRKGKKAAAKPNRGAMLRKFAQSLGTHSRKGMKKTAVAKPNKPKALGPVTTLSNSTVSGNTAYVGAGLMNYYYLGLYNATVTNNTAAFDGGGIVNSGLVGLAGSLITGNIANQYNEIDSCPCGGVTANSYNLFGNNGETNAQALYGFTPGANDFNATSDGDGVSTHIPTARNAILSATPGTNGGTTQTFALISGSPAIDKVPNAGCAAPPIFGVDQRGFGRNVNGNGVPSSNECDIGAYEFAAATATNVNHLGALVGRSGNVNVKWQSTSEAQLAGFNVWRKTGKGKWKKVNGSFLQAKHSGDAAGGKYRFRDETLRHPELNHYKLEIVYLDGHKEWSEVVGVK